MYPQKLQCLQGEPQACKNCSKRSTKVISTEGRVIFRKTLDVDFPNLCGLKNVRQISINKATEIQMRKSFKK